MKIKSANGMAFVNAMATAYLTNDREQAEMVMQGQILNNVEDREKQALKLFGLSCIHLMGGKK